MSRPLASCLVLCIAALAACDRAPSPAPSQEASAGAAPVADTGASAKVARTKTALPARYAAPLPASTAELQQWLDDRERFPPDAHVAHAIVNGEASMWQRLAEAAAKVPADDEQAWARGWHDRLVYRGVSPAFCERARPVMEAPPSALRTALAGAYAHACAGADERELILREDTPDRAVLEWYSDLREPPPAATMPYDARLARILDAAVAAQDRTAMSRAAFALAKHPDPAAAQALLDAHARITDARLAEDVAGPMRWSADDRVHAIGVAACQRVQADKDECTRRYEPAREPPMAEEDRAALAQTVRWLKEAGFARVSLDGSAPNDLPAADALLVRAGYAFWFDVETGTYPNEHDSLLRDLAALVKPALDGVVFEEVAPTDEEGEGPYLIRAYVDGERYETPAQNLGDWYDVDAVLRLLDAVVVARKAPERFVPLDTEDQTLTIVAARPEVLSAAFASGVIASGDPRTARALGTGFEEEVTRMLETGDTR